jgi:hypothetical protein
MFVAAEAHVVYGALGLALAAETYRVAAPARSAPVLTRIASHNALKEPTRTE